MSRSNYAGFYAEFIEFLNSFRDVLAIVANDCYKVFTAKLHETIDNIFAIVKQCWGN